MGLESLGLVGKKCCAVHAVCCVLCIICSGQALDGTRCATTAPRLFGLRQLQAAGGGTPVLTNSDRGLSEKEKKPFSTRRTT